MNKQSWNLRETIAVAIIGAVFAAIYIGWVQVWLVAQSLLGPLSMDIVMGGWFIASIIAAAIIRKPGVAFGAELIASAVELLMGAPGGAILLLTGAVQGAGAEAVFAATRWRNYSLPVLMAAGVGAAVFSFGYNWIRFGYWSLTPGLLLTMFVIRCLSGAILAGYLGKLIVDGLRKTGALAGFAIDADKRATAQG